MDSAGSSSRLHAPTIHAEHEDTRLAHCIGDLHICTGLKVVAKTSRRLPPAQARFRSTRRESFHDRKNDDAANIGAGHRIVTHPLGVVGTST